MMRILSTIILIFFGLSACQPNQENAKSAPVVEVVKDVEFFDHRGFTEKASQFVSSITDQEIALTCSFESINLIDEVPATLIKMTPQKGQLLYRFHIRVSQFENETETDTAFAALTQHGVYGDVPGLSYANDYAIRTNKEICVMHTGCAYAYYNHIALKDMMLDHMDLGVVSDSLVCVCGHSCNKN